MFLDSRLCLDRPEFPQRATEDAGSVCMLVKRSRRLVVDTDRLGWLRTLQCLPAPCICSSEELRLARDGHSNVYSTPPDAWERRTYAAQRSCEWWVQQTGQPSMRLTASKTTRLKKRLDSLYVFSFDIPQHQTCLIYSTLGLLSWRRPV